MLAYLLLASTLVIAACGLVYELVAGALASYLIGDTITRFSTVIGVYLFAMGVGAWLAKYIRRDLLDGGDGPQVDLVVALGTARRIRRAIPLQDRPACPPRDAARDQALPA
ncbi:MAG: hypothetical protein AAB252_06750, partial [Pseudomonadota bacterium]